MPKTKKDPEKIKRKTFSEISLTSKISTTDCVDIEIFFREAEENLEAMQAKKEKLKKKLLEDRAIIEASGDPDAETKLNQIDKALECLEYATDAAFKDYEEKQNKVRQTVASMENLSKKINAVEKEIDEMKDQQEEVLDELKNKQQLLREKLKTLSNLEDALKAIDEQLKCQNIDFMDKMSVLDNKRELLLLNEGYFYEEVAEIEEETRELKKEHADIIIKLEKQRQVLQNEYNIKKAEIDKIKDECVMSESSDRTESTDSKLSMKDADYLKNNFGIPLSLGLSELVAKKPSDPIHYLAHWLFKYRYNDEMLEKRKLELEELLAEREALAEKLRKHKLEVEAYSAVIDMIRKAEEEAEQRALELIQLMQEEQLYGEEMETEKKYKL